jgi:hypothetical protein
MVLETIGRAGRSAATQYQLFASAANASMLYVGFIDTRFHQRWGASGVLGADALLTLAGIAALLLLLRARPLVSEAAGDPSRPLPLRRGSASTRPHPRSAACSQIAPRDA